MFFELLIIGIILILLLFADQDLLEFFVVKDVYVGTWAMKIPQTDSRRPDENEQTLINITKTTQDSKHIYKLTFVVPRNQRKKKITSYMLEYNSIFNGLVGVNKEKEYVNMIIITHDPKTNSLVFKTKDGTIDKLDKLMTDPNAPSGHGSTVNLYQLLPSRLPRFLGNWTGKKYRLIITYNAKYNVYEITVINNGTTKYQFGEYDKTKKRLFYSRYELEFKDNELVMFENFGKNEVDRLKK